MKKVFDRNMAGIDLKCYEKLNDSTEPNTTEDDPRNMHVLLSNCICNSLEGHKSGC